jgi:hypothetical protein
VSLWFYALKQGNERSSIWKSRELVHNHQAKDRQISSLAVRIREALSRQRNLAGFGGDGRM